MNFFDTNLFRVLLELKAHLGNPYSAASLGTRNQTSIHDLDEILTTCTRSLRMIQGLRARQGKIFFVNTNPRAAELIRQTATAMNQSFMNEAWVGGSLTNWKQVSHSIVGVQRLKTHFHDLVQTHSLPKYEHARKKFEGIRPGEFPDLLILTARNLSEHALLLQEAKTYKIPVLCLGDDKFGQLTAPSAHESIEYFLPGNTESLEFLYFYLNLLVICWTRPV